MLELILTAINAKLAMLNKLANLYCLAERRPIDGGKTVPYAYRGGRDLQPINIDSGSAGYWRINGEGSDEYINDPYVAGQQRQVTWPLRFYAMAHRDSQFTASALADLIGSTITDADDDVAQLLDMEDVSITVSGRDLDTTALYGSEFDELDLPYHLAFIALTVTVTIRGAASCFPDPCDIDTDILHSFNFCDSATRARLTDEQVDCLTAALCETPPTLCEQLADVLPADVVTDVFDCLTPEAQAELLDSECVIPPCAKATAVLKNTANTTISTTSIASGASQNITAPDATAVLKNTANTTLLTEAIPSNVSENITAPDATITLNGSAYGSAPSGTTLNVVAPSLSLSTPTLTPAYGASFTVTATATGFTPTSYSFGFPSDSVGGYSCTTQAGNSLAITAKGYSTQRIYVTATDGVTTVGAMLTVTVAQMTQVTDFLTNTGIVDATITSAVRTLAMRLDDFGIWSKMRALYPFVGGTATTHKYNLKDPRDLDAAYRMIFAGGWTHNSNGITGNGTNTSGDSRLANNVPSQNSLNMGVYNRTAGTGGVEWSGSISPRTWLAGNISGTAFFDLNNSASTATTTAPADVRGTLMANRTDSASTELNLNAQGQRTTAAASSAPTATNFILGQFSGSGFNTARNYAAAWIADGLTPLEEANLRTVMQAFQTTLSRQV